MFENIAFRRRI